MDLWVGPGYAGTPHKVLLLGESTYGDDGGLTACISRWIHRDVRDFTFARLFNLLSGHRTESATVAQRMAFWHDISFYNFVPGNVGPTNASRPTAKHWRSGEQPLRDMLARLQPDAVLILGKEQAGYSKPIVAAAQTRHIAVPHPCARGLGVAAEILAGWRALRESRDAAGPRFAASCPAV